MANENPKEQQDHRNSWGVNPLKQRDETLVVLDGWHNWTVPSPRRNRHHVRPTIAFAACAFAVCLVGASLAWI